MTDINPSPSWSAVRQLEIGEFALGGANGNMNEQAKSLAARSEFLKQRAAYQYNTLVEANADITNIAVNQNVNVVDSGLYLKATAGATTLTKSPYDTVEQAKIFAKKVAGETINIPVSSNITLTTEQIEYKNIQFTGTLTSNITITLPALTGNWVFKNLTTGGFKISVICEQQTVPAVSLFNNEAFYCYASGRNLFLIEKPTRYLNIQMTGLTERTLTDDELNYDIIFFSGALTQNTVITLPKKFTEKTVRHQCSGGFDLQFKVLDSALSAISVKNGSNVDIISDAVNCYEVANNKLNATGGTLTSGKAVTQSLSINDAVANNTMVSQIAEGGTYIAVTGDTTLSIDQFSYNTIVFTGALTADATITIPKGVWDKKISNKTIGGFSLFIKCSGQVAAPLGLYDNAYYSVFAVGGTAYCPESKNTTRTASVNLTGLTYKTLSLKDIENSALFFGGTLTQDTVITFPKVKGVWRVRHQGTAGFKLQLKTLDSNEPLIELTNFQFIDVVSDAVNLYLIDKQNQVGKHKGEFKNLATYNMNDIVEHGSGRYKTVAAVATNQINPIDNYRFEKIGNKSINNKTISVVSETAQAINGTTVRRIISTSKDGSTVFSNQPYAQITESKDFGLTWTKILDLPAAEASLIEQMDNGELILFVTESGPTSNLVRRIYTTVGYGTENVQLVSRLMSQRDKNYFGGNWGFDAYKNIILATEYGAKYKPDADPADLSWTNVEGGNARYVWLSLDYGKTWKVIFDLNTKTDGVGVHIHSSVYDPYWNRIWVHHGDGATGRNGMYYSDDLGATWVYALQGNAAGANFSQATCTVVLPDCILFGSDSAPNGVYRLDRSQGKQPYKGYYALETAWKHPETSDTLLNAVCYKLAHSRYAPDMPYIFAFAPESNPTKGVIVATYDGYSFFQLWQDSVTRTVGNGVRHVVGVTLQNEVIARVQDDRFGAGVQTELRLKVV